MSKEKDVASLRSFLHEYEAAMAAGDISTLANSFLPDAIVMPQDGSVLIGREAIKSWYQSVLADSKAKQLTTVDEMEVTGDSAFLRMSFTTSFTPKAGGKPTDVSGKAIAIDKRQPDGSWKGSRLMWTTDKPLPATGK